jgi:nitroreductase
MTLHDIPERVPEYDVNPVFPRRWSPRAFTGAPIAREALFSLFEAARWAPSSNNAQPWRFIYALREGDGWASLFGLLTDSNKRWACNASALLVLLSRRTHLKTGATERTALTSHSLDAGAAWASLALQGVLTGWSSRAIGGFDREGARHILEIPADYHIEIMIAVGRRAEASLLPQDIREKEKPSPRRSVSHFVREARFGFAD